MKNNLREVVSQDSLGRDWLKCPSCERKTPMWGSGGVYRAGWCRWCGKEWKEEEL